MSPPNIKCTKALSFNLDLDKINLRSHGDSPNKINAKGKDINIKIGEKTPY